MMSNAFVAFRRLFGGCIVLWCFFGGSCRGNKQEPCKRDKQDPPFIAGVSFTHIAEDRYPYFVSLRMPAIFAHGCGGALIAPQWIVTAAHCILSNNEDGLGENPRVYVGAYKIDDLDDAEVMVPVKTVVHPFYNGDVGDGNDIALLKLPKPSRKCHASLPEQDALPEEGQQVIAMGFGRTSRTASFSPMLLEGAGFTFLPSDRCNEASAWNGLIKDGMMCAQDDLQDTCTGDSGGPAILANYGESGDHYSGKPEWDKVFGVTSFGTKECGTGAPAVFTLVSNFRFWIDGVISSDGALDGP